jgi:hypothetical protein
MQVELFTGRLTNLPPFAPLLVRVLAGILMGAIPHAFEEVGMCGCTWGVCECVCGHFAQLHSECWPADNPAYISLSACSYCHLSQGSHEAIS